MNSAQDQRVKTPPAKDVSVESARANTTPGSRHTKIDGRPDEHIHKTLEEKLQRLRREHTSQIASTPNK